MGETYPAPARGAVDDADAADVIRAVTRSAEHTRRIAAGLAGVPHGDEYGNGGAAFDALHAHAARAERGAVRWAEMLEDCARHLDSAARAVSHADAHTADALRAGAAPDPGGTPQR